MEVKFVMENRHANKVERDACVKALQDFGMDNPEDSIFYLYGRYDAPYGWYLFGVTPLSGKTYADGQPEKYLILGDCLDVLPDYNRVLTLKDVHEFAIGEMDGRYEAIQEWGVFQSISMGLKTALAGVIGDEGLDETVEWNEKRKEWMLRFDLSFTTGKGETVCKTIFIPAHLSCKQEADDAFAYEWKSYRLAFDVEATAQECINERTSFGEAWDHAKSKERSIYEIGSAIRNYLEYGKTDHGENRDVTEAAQDLQFKDGQGYVWVLTIMKEGQNFPEVHKTFDGAVESAIADIQEHMDEEDVDEYDYVGIKKALEEERYWKDENTDTVYDVCECPVCK